MRRREFVAFLGGASAISPIIASAQPSERERRIGVVIPASPGLPGAQLIVEAIRGQLRDLGLVGGSEETHNVPIVFVLFGDPVGRALVASLSHPGGNITGFTHYDAALSGKWVETLKVIAPQLT